METLTKEPRALGNRKLLIKQKTTRLPAATARCGFGTSRLPQRAKKRAVALEGGLARAWLALLVLLYTVRVMYPASTSYRAYNTQHQYGVLSDDKGVSDGRCC